MDKKPFSSAYPHAVFRDQYRLHVSRSDCDILNKSACIVISAETFVRTDIQSSRPPIIRQHVDMLIAQAVGRVRLPAKMLPVNSVVTEESSISSNPYETESILHQRINRNYGPLPHRNGCETSRQRIMFCG